MRRVLSFRWLALHALALVLVVAFLALGVWQIERAEAGNARSFAYALEWPAFAVFVVVMWARMVHDELHPAPPAEDRTGPQTDPRTDAAAEDPAPAAAAEIDDAGPGDEGPDDELAAYNRYLAALHAGESRTGRRGR